MTINEEETKLPILRSEFELALYNSIQNKAPGADNITTKLLKCVNTIVKDVAYQLTRDIYEEG